MSEHVEQMSKNAGSREINEPPNRDHLKVDEAAAAGLDEAFKQLLEVKESLSAIDHVLEAAFAVIDRQFKRLQQRVIAASPKRSKGGAP